MPEPSRWVGWLRRSARSPWQAVCRADDLASCHRRLLRLAAERGVPTVHTIMTGGHRPPEGEK